MKLSMFATSIFVLFVFVLQYRFLYRWNKQFLLNRIYLILSVLFSIIIPFLSFDVFPYRKIIHGIEGNEVPIWIQAPETVNWILIIYLTGFGLSLIYFLYRVIKIIVLIRKTDFQDEGRLKIANSQSVTFSFLNYIFLEDKSDDIILNHELAHVSGFHTFDILFIEVAKAILWFNPFVYIIKYYIQENHEFEADFEAIKRNRINKIEMAEYLLDYSKNQVLSQTKIINNFYSLIKNRLNMLAKNKSVKKAAYLIVIPVILVLLSAFSFKSYPVYETPDGEVLKDTLIPGYYYVTDTIVEYDSDTKEETMTIVEAKISMDEYLNSLNFSGRMVSVIDTVPYYDPDTKKETIMVQKIKYPFELRYIFDKLSWKQQEAIVKQYGSQTNEELKD